MTRRASVRKNVLAARGSFWEALPQDTAAKVDGRRTVSDSELSLPGLYDQLIHLKGWKEETAELCSAAEARELSGGPATCIDDILARCSREDSAMRLSSATRSSSSSSAHSASNSSMTARTCSGSSQGASHYWDRHFCRSSFSAARPYETRKHRQRLRTFAMEELDPSNSFAVCLEEVVNPMAASNQEAGKKKQNTLLGTAVSSLSAADDMLRSVMKSALYQTTGHMQNARLGKLSDANPALRMRGDVVALPYQASSHKILEKY